MIVLRNEDGFYVAETERANHFMTDNLAGALVFTSFQTAFNKLMYLSSLDGKRNFYGSLSVYSLSVKDSKFDFKEISGYVEGAINPWKILSVLLGYEVEQKLEIITRDLFSTEITFDNESVNVKFTGGREYNRFTIRRCGEDEYELHIKFVNSMEDYLRYNRAIKKERKFYAKLETLNEVWRKNVGIQLVR